MLSELHPARWWQENWRDEDSVVNAAVILGTEVGGMGATRQTER